jgi:hypothetical protein
MMERYMEVKRENPGTMLLFRMGDFYELFYEDAQNAAKRAGTDADQSGQVLRQSDTDGRISVSSAGRLSAEADSAPGFARRFVIRSKTPKRPKDWCAAKSLAWSPREL